MMQVQEMIDDEKREMYNKLSKSEIIEMLIQANKVIDSLTVRDYENGFITIDYSSPEID